MTFSEALEAMAKELHRLGVVRDSHHAMKDPDFARWHWYVQGFSRAYEMIFTKKTPRREVELFALAMEQKLKENEWKGSWGDEKIDFLLSRLDEEILELRTVLLLKKSVGAPRRVLREAADVANFCMMIAAVAGGLEDES